MTESNAHDPKDSREGIDDWERGSSHTGQQGSEDEEEEEESNGVAGAERARVKTARWEEAAAGVRRVRSSSGPFRAQAGCLAVCERFLVPAVVRVACSRRRSHTTYHFARKYNEHLLVRKCNKLFLAILPLDRVHYVETKLKTMQM